MTKTHRNGQTLLVAMFFVLLTLIGLFTATDYGLPCDEPAEQVILRENLKEYAFHFLGENSNAVRYYDALGIQRISESIERDHGQAAYYPAAPLLQMDDASAMTTLWHAYTWLWFMVGVFALYRLARAMGLSRTVACATALLLYLSPRFFAEGHYNNKDVVLLSLVLCTLASGARFLRKPTFPRALVFALAGALATNTKIIGVLPWGLMGLATLFSLLARHELTRRRLAAGLTAIGAFLVFYAALTPALWADPLGYFPYVLSNASSFSRWTGVVLFDGTYYNPTRGLPLPRTYLPKMIAYTMPIAFLALAVIGQIRAAVLWFRKDERRPLMVVLTLLWLLPLAYVVWARPLLYNGWRHFYFLYAPIAALGGLGMDALRSLVRKNRALKTSFTAAIAAVFLWQGAGIAMNHPYQFAYYNLLAKNVQTSYELDYWDVSTVNAMRRLCAGAERNQSLPLMLGSRDDMSWFGVEHGYAVLAEAEQAELTITSDADAPYLFYNTTYAGIYGVEPPQGYHALFSLHSYGNVLCTVYERETAE
ncbi:MAG: glycosyltransferase family 39 protein [Eubacteriales bacterium]|nr:glycosyltransferase family 39 protein [Eubacteriales bacterium]